MQPEIEYIYCRGKRGKSGYPGMRGSDGTTGPTGGIDQDPSIDCLTLATTGGTASMLCYYEEYQDEVPFLALGSYTGSVLVTAVRMNDSVTLTVDRLLIENIDTGDSGMVTSNDPAIPSRFAPSSTASMPVVFNLVSTDQGMLNATFQILDTGVINYYLFADANVFQDFSLTTFIDFYPVSLTYFATPL